MAETLLITAEEISDTTILGGNIDVDKYRFCIFDAQISVLEPLLGSELYDYIITNRNNLSGVYLTLFQEYIKPILKFSVVASYLEIAPYMVDNGGVFKHSPDNKEIVNLNENTTLIQKYKGLADMFIIRFEKFICENNIPEYKTAQDEVNAQRNLRTTIGWKL